MAANQAQGYTHGARAFHWLTAALVLTSIPIGITMVNAPYMGPVTDTLFHLHRSIGALVLFVMLGRLVYRLRNSPPPLPHDMSPMLQTAAHATHWTLYALLIVQPILGWIALLFLPFVVLALAIFCAVKAYQKELFKLPLLGDFAEKQVGAS